MPNDSKLPSSVADDGSSPHPISAGETIALKQALVQSRGVKQKVDAVVDSLETSNDQVRNLISGGATSLPAGESLAENERVESTVKEVADDLDRVNGALTQGVEHLEVIGQALSDSHSAQRQTEADLVASEQHGEAARERSLHDAATGLPNRALFEDRLVHAISMAERHAWTLAILFLDLDRFKDVNDTFGHAAGDAVLIKVAERMALHIRDEDTVCRYGGDEFLFLLVNPQGADNVERIVETITASIAEPMDIGAATVSIGASVGVAYFPDNGHTGPELVAFADTAMYGVKRQGQAVTRPPGTVLPVL